MNILYISFMPKGSNQTIEQDVKYFVKYCVFGNNKVWKSYF